MVLNLHAMEAVRLERWLQNLAIQNNIKFIGCDDCILARLCGLFFEETMAKSSKSKSAKGGKGNKGSGKPVGSMKGSGERKGC